MTEQVCWGKRRCLLVASCRTTFLSLSWHCMCVFKLFGSCFSPISNSRRDVQLQENFGHVGPSLLPVSDWMSSAEVCRGRKSPSFYINVTPSRSRHPSPFTDWCYCALLLITLDFPAHWALLHLHIYATKDYFEPPTPPAISLTDTLFINLFAYLYFNNENTVKCDLRI